MKIKFATAFLMIGILLTSAFAHAQGAHSAGSQPLKFVKYSQISVKVKASLAQEKIGRPTHIKVHTNNNGGVFLSGEVNSRQEADRAVSIARATEGVTSVTSTIRISREVARMIV